MLSNDTIGITHEIHPLYVNWKVILESGGLTLALQWVLYIIANFFHTEKFYDFGGSLGFLLAVWHSYPRSFSPFATHADSATVPTQRQFLLSLLVTIWTIRLGTFLLFRVLKVGEDSRFSKVKYQPLRFFAFWTVQALWIFVTSLPVLLLNSTIPSSAASSLAVVEFGDAPYVDFGGLFLWVFGFLLECTADFQKFAFKNRNQKDEKWMSSGVFRWSRHPNYFGEMVLWVGVFLITSPALPSQQVLILSLCSPVFVILLITFVTGIPILERKAERKYGKYAGYQEYKNNTPLLIPFIGSRG